MTTTIPFPVVNNYSVVKAVIQYISKVLYILSGSKSSLIFLLLTFALTSILEAFGIGLIGPFLSIAANPDQFINQNPFLYEVYTQLNLQSSYQIIPLIGFGIAIIFVIKSLLYFLARAYVIKFSFDQKGKLCSRLLNAHLSAPYTFHLSKNTATLIKNIVVETNKFCNGCLLPLLTIASNLVVITVLLLLLLYTSTLFLSLILTILLPTFLLFYTLGKKFRSWGKAASVSQQEIIRIINHSLGGLKETRIIGVEPYFEHQMAQQVQILERVSTLFQASQILPRITIETFLVLAIITFVSIFALQGSEQELTSILGVFAVASVRLIPAMSQFIQSIGQLQSNTYILDMLHLDLRETEKLKAELRAYKPRQPSSGLNSSALLRNAKTIDKPLTLFNRIDLKQVSYSYPGATEAAITDISFSIKRGQAIGLIGKSGAGKTTLVDVILGLLEPQSGDICVDGQSIYGDMRAWQNLIGYIPQQIFLMDETIERNIAFGVPDNQIDSERLNKAIKAAQLEELVEQLPQGIKTSVGERGVRLSGGQRQRIGIARALYHEREILVLDEATSALDNETESLVNDAIRSLSGQKTMIIIAHRLSTVEHCDCIYLMQNGRVVQSGSYREVVLKQKSSHH